MRFGFGFGLSRNNFLGGGFADLVKAAGGVLYLDARKADGAGPLTGNDSPFKDLTNNGNDGTLTNSAGTGTSGWQAAPNLLRIDGVDDFVAFADTASLDIVNAPLAIGITMKVSVDQTKFMLSNNEYSLLLRTSNRIEFNYSGGVYSQFSYTPSTYCSIVFYWDGVNMTSYENGVQKAQSPLVGPLIGSGPLKLGSRTSSFANLDIATQTIYTGSDINKILETEAKISAEYLALNP